MAWQPRVRYLNFKVILLLTILHFAVENYEVTVYTGNAFMAGTDARIYVELFGESRNSGEVELAGKKNAFARGR